MQNNLGITKVIRIYSLRTSNVSAKFQGHFLPGRYFTLNETNDWTERLSLPFLGLTCLNQRPDELEDPPSPAAAASCSDCGILDPPPS